MGTDTSETIRQNLLKLNILIALLYLHPTEIRASV